MTVHLAAEKNFAALSVAYNFNPKSSQVTKILKNYSIMSQLQKSNISCGFFAIGFGVFLFLYTIRK